MRRWLSLGVAIALGSLVALTGGCGGKASVARETPSATADAFLAAIQKGDFAAAASAFDYNTEARQMNPDWDDIPASQRNMIMEKMADQRQEQLKSLGGMLSGDVRVEPPQTQGDSATVDLRVSTAVVRLYLAKVGEVWRLSSFAEM